MFMSDSSIKNFVLIHYELKDVCKILNDMFSTVLCLLVLVVVVRMMFFYYVLSFIIVSMINDTHVRHKYKTFSCFTFWIFRLHWEVFILSKYCQDITKQVGLKSVIEYKRCRSKSMLHNKRKWQDIV